MPTITATFETRREAELVIEHLVQEHEIDRDAITVETDGDENSAGEAPGGSDLATDLEDSTEDDAALNGAIVVSVIVDTDDDADTVEDILHEFGGAEVVQEG